MGNAWGYRPRLFPADCALSCHTVPMIFLDDDRTWLVADTRRAMIDALLECLPVEPGLWQVQMIAAARLGHREPLEISVHEE